jgi:methylenetetrahydrofolate dehydrogenase (NADP+)/methenyltetrahydrofolate cyclohydrolase
VKLISGKETAEIIKADILSEVAALLSSGQRAPHLTAVLVGNDGASETYVNNKIKTCMDVGFRSSLLRFESSVSQNELLATIEKLNNDPDVDGFIVQLPLPDHIDVNTVTEAILPSKDVDGFHPVNIGRMTQQQPCYIPATPKGIIQLLQHYQIETAGKHCVVVGRSNIVGTPVSILLSRNTNPGNCTVTICHSKTKNLKEFTLQADILIAAIGRAEFITGDMIKEGAVVIDVGMTRIAADNARGYRLAGDVHFESAAPRSSYITPVPGGVGPMTIIGLLQNTLLAAQKVIY